MARKGEAYPLNTYSYDMEPIPSPAEVMRIHLAERYHEEVYRPRLALWTMFIDFLKDKPPTHVYHDPEREGAPRNPRQWSANWVFRKTTPDPLLATTIEVAGFSRDNDEGDINAFTILLTRLNLEDGNEQMINFTGQVGDTFITASELEARGRPLNSREAWEKGAAFFTRSPYFEGTFSSPISLPIELSAEMFTHNHPPATDEVSAKKEVDALATHYQYLFGQTPRLVFIGIIDAQRDLFKYPMGGDETLTYLQAEALFEELQTCALLSPAEFQT